MRHPRRPARAAAALATAALLGGCASAGAGSAPTWAPSPAFGTNGEGPNVHLSPIVPVPAQTGAGASGGPPNSSQPTSPGAPATSGSGADPFVVAEHLSAPVGLTLLPDNTALVGERTTGRIVRVQPRPGQPVQTIRTLPGLSTAGGGGLLDLALSPTYTEDGLIYAYITTARDNRVVDFTLRGAIAPVVTGIPRGATGNAGRIAFGTDGSLYIGTGDTGHPSLAAAPTSLAGKVLRVTDIGAPAPGNPSRSRVFTSGHRGATGLCAVPRSPQVLEVETGGAHDEVNVLTGGDYYGWPLPSGTVHQPAGTLPAGYGGAGGCAVQDGLLWVTSLDGRALLGARLTGTGASTRPGRFGVELRNRYGRLRTVVAADDGALWLTTSNRDGHGHPVADDERVIRYLPPTGGGTPNPA